MALRQGRAPQVPVPEEKDGPRVPGQDQAAVVSVLDLALCTIGS